MQETAQQLRQAEMNVARLTGEMSSLDSQMSQVRATLETYGIDPAKADEALEILKQEEARLQAEVDRLTAALSEALP